uniref:Uncharacterized protein n=1 Tax=Rhizophora mucronata TaxID=61149 RepID=A0A2P2PAM5_RHIMU
MLVRMRSTYNRGYLIISFKT